MVEPQSLDHVFNFPADDPILDLKDDPVLDFEEDPKEEEEDMEVEENIPPVAALHAGSPPISPPPLPESSFDSDSAAPVTADRTKDTDALQGSVRTLVRGMATHRTKIITGRNGVDSARRRVDTFDVDIEFVK
uniref:Uncharacterized protein n=1 Tax=Tanacetum cinerariifolium TaxID=118510 RepID=A0A6L2NGK4_TANCI|nr:hypothetical protein [Tanacetum cinerariifolium]